MDFTWTTDVGATWPGGVGRHIPEDLAVDNLLVCPGPQDTYTSVLNSVARVLTQSNPWQSRPWEVFFVAQEDNPFNRARGFWRRFGADLGIEEGESALELCRLVDRHVLRVAAAPFTASDELIKAAQDRVRMSFRRVMLLPGDDSNVARFLAGVLHTPNGAGYEWQGFVAGVAVVTDGCIMVPDETERHEPGLAFYGSPDNIALLRAALIGPTASDT